MSAERGLVLFNYDWDQVGFARWTSEFQLDSAGFDLFSFPRAPAQCPEGIPRF
jgi:hypothetical protein